MPTPLSFQGSAFGVGFTLQADTPKLLEEARLRMPPTWRLGSSGSPRRKYALHHATDGVLVEAGGAPLARGLSHTGALDVLESDLQLFVAQYSRAFVFVHAAVVGIHGKALLLPGTSGAGKTTLVQALLKAGATYYSDEYALLDGKGRVHPYARALSVRTADGGEKVRVHVSSALAPTGTRPLPLGVVVQTEYCKGGRWIPKRLTPGEVVLSLLVNTVPARDRPAEVMATLARAVSGARGFRSVRGAAERVAEALLHLADEAERGARVPAYVHPARIHPAVPSSRRRVRRSRR